MPEYPLALLLVGVAAGVLSGMFGIGGGVVIVPALTILFGFELQNAVGTSLVVLIWPLSIFAVAAYYRAGLLDVMASVMLALGLVLGSFFGAEIALNLPEATMQRIYGVFLIYVGWRFLEPRKLLAARRDTPARLETPHPGDSAEAHWLPMLSIGTLAGVAAGLFGIGGGLVIVPALVELLRYSQKRAVGTSLAALMPPVSIGAVISYYNAGMVSLAASAVIAIGLIGGAFFGARIALGLPSSTVRRLYGAFLLAVSLRFLLQL
ncbi:MAG: sulfite exporter TauE/SafE family protein [Chloroflexota bacterium]